MESAHQFSSRPYCNNTWDVPSLTQSTALSAIPFVSDLCGVDVQWFQERSSQALPNSKELSVQMTLGFPFGSKNICKPLCVSWEVFVLHGYDWIHWVAKSCTTTAYRWLFRDSQPSLRTLWSAVIKSPKFSARGTASPLRLLHGALVILVLWQISQFRSLGKWILTLCLPKSTLLVGSKDNPWEEFACESSVFRNSVIHKILSEFLQPFWYVGMTQVSPFLLVILFLFGLGILVGLFNNSSDFSEEYGSLRSCLSTRSLDTVAGGDSSHAGLTVLWFLTVDPLRMSIRVHCKAFLAIKLLAYPRGLSLSRIYPLLCRTPLPLHASALLHWL